MGLFHQPGQQVFKDLVYPLSISCRTAPNSNLKLFGEFRNLFFRHLSETFHIAFVGYHEGILSTNFEFVDGLVEVMPAASERIFVGYVDHADHSLGSLEVDGG